MSEHIVEKDAALLAAFKRECDAVGLPYDPPGLVRHHRANAALAAAFDVETIRLTVQEVLATTEWYCADDHDWQGRARLSARLLDSIRPRVLPPEVTQP